jgi:hypothetical protein
VTENHPQPPKTLAIQPPHVEVGLVLDEPVGSSLRGWLYYSYSERWGHKPPHKPHHFMRRRIEFNVAAGAAYGN